MGRDVGVSDGEVVVVIDEGLLTVADLRGRGQRPNLAVADRYLGEILVALNARKVEDSIVLPAFHTTPLTPRLRWPVL